MAHAPRSRQGLQDDINEFIERHEVAWELGFSALAIRASSRRLYGLRAHTGDMTLVDAQRAIATDWITAWQAAGMC